MGHYASEMDPDFGKPTFGQQRRARHRQNAIDELAKLIAVATESGITPSGIEVVANRYRNRAATIVDSIIAATR